jgi:hypothetical protein
MQVKVGSTLEQIRNKFLPAEVEFALSINGRIVDNMAVVPRAGEMITAIPVIGASGQDGGKSIMRLLAMLVVAAVASYASGLMFGVGTIGANIAAGAITIVGGLLVNYEMPKEV